MSRVRSLAKLALLSAWVGSSVSGADAPPRFAADSQVVVLDIVARDRKDGLVADLRADEVQVFEDGKACEVLSFRPVRAKARLSPSDPERAPLLAPAASPMVAAATPTRASLVVLVFDRLSTETAPLARRGGLDLLRRSFPPDTWFSVFEVGYGIRLLEPFTTDVARLQGAIERATSGDRDRRAGPLAPPLPPVKPDPTEEVGSSSGIRIPGLREVAGSMGGQEAQNEERVNGMDSLYAVLGVAKALENVEGRKSIVYFTEAWALGRSSQTLYDTVVSAANRANVAVHTVDTRGLSVLRPGETLNPFNSALTNFTAESRAIIDPLNQTPQPVRGASGAFEVMEDYLRGPRLANLAEDTGGLAIADTNDLGSRLALVADELALYYEVVYAPANPVMDGRFRRIEAKVSRPGVRLRTRKGYFGDPRKQPSVAAYELPLLEALAAPEPKREFTVRSGVLCFGPSGAERDCVFLAEVPLSEVQLDQNVQEVTYRGHLSLVGFIKDGEGRVVARLTQDLPMTGPLALREQALTESALFRRSLPLAPGEYTLEVAIQDRARGAQSVSRDRFSVPASTDPSLGSVVIVDRAVPAPSETPLGDPLRIGDLLFVPSLESAFVEGARAHFPVFVALWPKLDVPAAELKVELRQGGDVLASVTPALPAADSTGRVTWVGSIPASLFSSGRHELVVVARQGLLTSEKRLEIEITTTPKETASAAPGPVTDPQLRDLLERAGRYVVEYEESFRNIVAEETYIQRSVRPKWIPKALPSPPVRFEDGSLQVRTRADVVFVRLGGEVPWGVFRDVFEANGAKVRDRDERLQRLFAQASDSALEQAKRILNESSRFNMGLIRTVNIPTLPLAFLHPRNQHRFAFRLGDRRKFGEFEGIEVLFEEVVRPGLVSTGSGGTLTATGRFWIEPTRGAILRSETAYGWKADRRSGVTGRIATEYRPEPTLGIFVPEEMKETYYESTEASAKYTNLRRFAVTVESERLDLPSSDAPTGDAEPRATGSPSPSN